MADPNTISEVQRSLARLQKTPLHIVKLSEQLREPKPPSSSLSKSINGGSNGNSNTHQRQSTASNADDATLTHTHDQDVNPSPSSLASDLEHYRQLFKKLHFSYLEQVSKEKFLRAIVGDPPQVVDPSENAALEAELAKVKVQLGQQKAEVDSLVSQLEARGRELASRYEGVQLQATQLGSLPDEVSGLREHVAELEESTSARQQELDGAEETDPRMKMAMGATADALDQRRVDIAEMDREIASLRQSLPAKARQVERLEGELRPLENQRNEAAQSAEEARARKERRDGGAEDQIELKGRWYQSATGVIRELVGAGEADESAKTTENGKSTAN